MNKKIIFAVVLLLVALFALCACKGEKTVLEMYEDVKNASGIVQTISIKSGSTEIASEKRTYNMTSLKVTIERKTPSDLDSSDPYVTTTETKDFAKSDAVAKLSGLTMTGVVTTQTAFEGTVANADLKTAFGVDGAKVKGDATVQLLAQDGKVVKMTVTYTSSNDNAVTITTTFTY